MDEEKEAERPATPETEEDGEINDGEKVRKAFIPRVPCKYYQRGKCTWGRTCKFLHPGVNDTGNYSFLEFQDPNAKVYERQSLEQAEAEQAAAAASREAMAAETAAESAWERGVRQAREMKERARLRKLAEKDTFREKQMNLSLREFEEEGENDERYMNVEKYGARGELGSGEGETWFEVLHIDDGASSPTCFLDNCFVEGRCLEFVFGF